MIFTSDTGKSLFLIKHLSICNIYLKTKLKANIPQAFASITYQFYFLLCAAIHSFILMLLLQINNHYRRGPCRHSDRSVEVTPRHGGASRVMTDTT